MLLQMSGKEPHLSPIPEVISLHSGIYAGYTAIPCLGHSITGASMCFGRVFSAKHDTKKQEDTRGKESLVEVCREGHKRSTGEVTNSILL